jgi:CRISPR/Cas system CSM-associated protein Csm3 (group 7 of RAMP superfamily)
MHTYNRIHRLSFELEFPNGLSVGDGCFGNEQLLAKDGAGQLVLRGTSFVGVLRHAYEKTFNNADTFFGSSAENGQESPLVVSDIVLNAKSSIRRTSHLRNRHTGAVLDGGLYSIEATPKGTTANITLWYRGEDENFFTNLAGLISEGLTFGGNSNRGVGLAAAKEFYIAKYILSDKKQYADYLNDFYNWRNNKQLSSGEKLEISKNSESENLTLEFTLRIPRGQDILIANGNENSPQIVTGTDEKDYYLLPGSSLHGLFRSWITRLAKREGKNISDSAKVYNGKKDTPKEYTGEQLGWMFDKKLDVHRIDKEYPVESLFGSLHKAGRLHISDSYCLACDSSHIQHRKHVALDAISGGAIEGALFDNDVLTAGEFPVKIIVKQAKEHEAKWIAQTLKALDLGIVRVGSSKASGRLELKQNPTTNKYEKFFNIK